MPRRTLNSLKEKNKTNFKSSFNALSFIPRFFKEIWNINKGLFIISAICRLIAALLPVVILWIGKEIVDEILLQIELNNPDYTQLWTYVAVEFGLIILSELFGRAISLTDGLLGDEYNIATSVKIIKKTNQINISQLEDPDYYDKLERARTQTTGRVGLLSNVLAQAQSIITITSLIVGLIYFEPLLIILLVLSIIPAFINEIKFSQQQYSLARSWTSERRELDYLRFIGANNKTAKEIKLFGLTDFVVNRFKNLSNSYYLLNRKLSIRRTSLGFLFNVLGTVAYYGAYVFIIFRVLTGVITLGELTFLSGSFNRLMKSLQDFFARFTRISESALYLKDYFDFIDMEVEDQSQETEPLPKSIEIGFEFRDVRFAYPESNSEVLKGVNFTLKAGEKMAFVGQNGAGKTTLIKLMLRFYEPTSGEILLDGININQFNKAEYQEYFGVIFQDFFRYEFTLRENIAIGHIEEVENLEKIKTAAQLSLANEVVGDLEFGYEQQLGRRFSNGVELSGGQWQKVALARAYMKNAKVMILDEPTSALDAKAESEVFTRFIGLTESKTSIIISHRFSTVRQADKIVVLKEGKILEVGTHIELMQNKLLYSELFTLQAEGYK